MKPSGLEPLCLEFPEHWKAYATACAADSRPIRPIAPNSDIARAIDGASANGGNRGSTQEKPGSVDLEFQVRLWNVLIDSLTQTVASRIEVSTGRAFSQRFIESVRSVPSLRARRLAMEVAASRIAYGKDADESEYEAIALALQTAPLGAEIAFNAFLFTRRYSTAEMVFATKTTRIGIWLDASEPTKSKLMQAWGDWCR